MKVYGNNKNRLLILALILVMVPLLCGCRTRITNNTEVNSVLNDADGTLTEEYQMRRDELSIPVAETPVIKGGSDSEDYYDYEYYDEDASMLSDFEQEDDEVNYDDSDTRRDRDRNGRDGLSRRTPGSQSRTGIKVTLDPNGGKCSVEAVNVYKGRTYMNLPVPEREGYVFEGWYTEKKKGTLVNSATKVTEDKPHTLYAHWKKQDKEVIKVTVTFDLYSPDASLVSGEDTKEVVVGEAYGELPEAEWEGYEFKGWYTEKKEGEKVTAKTKVKIGTAHTLYAHWNKQVSEAEKVTVLFDPNSTEAKFISGESSMEAEVGSIYGDLPVVEWEGHIFKGWYTEKEGGVIIRSATRVTNDQTHTLYAHWDDQAEEPADPDPHKPDDPDPGQPDNPEPGQPDDPEPGQPDNPPENPDPQEPTEPAKTYNVSFDLNGDSAQFTSGGGSMEVEENGRYGSLPTAKRTGHTFAGWYTAADGGSRVNGGDRFTVNADQTLYAHWDYDPYADWDNKFKEDTNNITDPLPCYIDESDDDEVDMVKSCKGRIAESDEDPEIIIKFIKNFDEKDDEEKQAKAEELIEAYRTDHPDAAVRVILMSSKALTGGEKRKLAYRLALLDAMYGFYGEDGVMDAASELEVELEYPYLY